MKFGLLKAVTSTNTKPEVVFSNRGRHLEKWILRHISAADVPIWTNLSRQLRYLDEIWFADRL